MEADLLTPELHRACKNLLERFSMLGMQSTHILGWEALPADLLKRVPAWLIQLHATYPLGQVSLRTMKWKGREDVGFRFLSPEEVQHWLDEDSGYDVLRQEGYFPFGEEGDAMFGPEDRWLCRSDAGPNSPIYWFSGSDWDGSAEGLPAALTFASRRIALFFCCGELVGNREENPPPVMWVPEAWMQPEKGQNNAA